MTAGVVDVLPWLIGLREGLHAECFPVLATWPKYFSLFWLLYQLIFVNLFGA